MAYGFNDRLYRYKEKHGMSEERYRVAMETLENSQEPHPTEQQNHDLDIVYKNWLNK